MVIKLAPPPASYKNEIEDYFIAEDGGVQFYDPLDKETIQGCYKAFKVSGEQVDFNLARLYARGLYQSIRSPRKKLAMLGIIQHLVYAPLNQRRLVYWENESNKYVVNIALELNEYGFLPKGQDSIVEMMQNHISFFASQQWIQQYLSDYWGVSIDRKPIRELINHLGAMGCFTLTSYTIQEMADHFRDDNGKVLKKITEFHHYDLVLLLMIASEWEKLYLQDGNTLQTMPHHKGYLLNLVFDKVIPFRQNLLTDKTDDRPKEVKSFGTRTGLGYSPYPEYVEEHADTSEQTAVRDARMRKKTPWEQLGDTYSHVRTKGEFLTQLTKDWGRQSWNHLFKIFECTSSALKAQWRRKRSRCNFYYQVITRELRQINVAGCWDDPRVLELPY